ILPRTARLDVERTHAAARERAPHRVRNELRSVVGSDELRFTMDAEQIRQQTHDVLGGDASLYQNRMTLARILIDDRQQLQAPTIFRLVHDEIIAPDVVLVRRALPHGAVVAAAESAPLPLPSRNTKSLLAPQTLNSLSIHTPAFAA